MNMKKFVTIAMAAGMITSLCASCAAEKTTLVVSTYAAYSEEERANIYDYFEEEYNCEILTDEGNNAERLAKFQADPSAYDVVNLSDYYAQMAIDDGLFAEIGDDLTNREYLYDIAQAPNGEEYGSAYVFNRIGIVYDATDLSEPIDSWEDLWELADLGVGIALPAITTTAGPMLLNVAADQMGEELSEDNVDAAFEKLAELSDDVVKYYTSSADTVTMLINGEISVAVLQDFSYSSCYEASEDFIWVDPTEGTWGCTNVSNVSAESDNIELATKYVDFLLELEVQEREAAYNAPSRTDVVLSEEEAQFLTYGADQVGLISMPDWSLYLANSEAWIDTWNETLA